MGRGSRGRRLPVEDRDILHGPCLLVGNGRSAARAAYALFSDQANTEVVLAFLDRQPVGFAVFFHNFSTFLSRRGIYLEDLYVRENSRGYGIGKKLLQYIARLALERQCGRMEWSVLNWNTPAINFYKSIGAKPMDEWTVYRLEQINIKKLADSKL